jgi:8-oxo-dGTP pyrophosphatase MutT (NUDIX family)
VSAPPTLVDRLWRLSLSLAYRCMLVYWRVFQPHTFGVCVAVWCRGRLLLVRHSYKPGWSIPTGGRRQSEPPEGAARRELREEVGIDAAPGALSPALSLSTRALGNHDHLEFFELWLASEPALSVDGREIVEARFATPDEARAMPLLLAAREYLARRGAF